MGWGSEFTEQTQARIQIWTQDLHDLQFMSACQEQLWLKTWGNPLTEVMTKKK